MKKYYFKHFKQRPLILITNDDGIDADGIGVTADAVKDLAWIVVVAPWNNQSGVSHRITLKSTIEVQRVQFKQYDIQAYKLVGTPADCVRLGVFGLIKERISLVIAGVNHGANMGNDVVYSGTVAAAREGAMLGIPSMAVSVNNGRFKQTSLIRKIIHESASWILRSRIPKSTFININIPGKIKNNKITYEITRLGKRIYSTHYIRSRMKRGKSIYRLKESISGVPAKGTDIGAIHNGHVSITPLTLNFTDLALLKNRKIGEIEK